jgi:hypothetical protein
MVMKRTLLTVCAAALVAVSIAACGGAADQGGAKAEPAPAADDAAKFAGKWMSDGGQFTEYVFEDGKLYVKLGSEKNECTLEGGQISYRSAGMTVRMHYRFVDDNTIEYTDPSMPAWSLIQKRQ